jgi:nucleotide-binding universal stress UspA family protein
MKPVAVGVDGTPASLRALRWGAAEARCRRGPLHLLYALGWSPFRAHLPWTEHHLFNIAGQTLAEVTASVRRLAPDLRVTGEVRGGPPTEALCAAVPDAALLVVGTSLARGGGAALAVAEHAACPVVLVPGGWSGTDAELRVVAAADGSPAEGAVVGWGLAAAARYGTSLLVLRTGETADPEQRRALVRSLARWRAAHPSVPVTLRLVLADPGAALARAARSARLLVVGPDAPHEYGLAHPACPLAVVHPRAASKVLASKVLAGRPG